MLSQEQLAAKLQQLQGRPGAKVKAGTAQKRPRCFAKEKVPQLFGTYYGPLVKDKRSGEGLFVWDDGWVVEGTWKDDELHGFCRILFAGPEVPRPLDPKQANTALLAYAGHLRASRLDGEGTAVLYARLTSLNGDSYRGSFEKDLESGRGLKTFGGSSKLLRYEGAFEKGLMQGRGTLTL